MRYRLVYAITLLLAAHIARAQSRPNTIRWSAEARLSLTNVEFDQLDSALVVGFRRAGLRRPPPPPATLTPLERVRIADPITWWANIALEGRNEFRQLTLTIINVETGERIARDSAVAAPRVLADSASVLAHRLGQRVPR